VDDDSDNFFEVGNENEIDADPAVWINAFSSDEGESVEEIDACL